MANKSKLADYASIAEIIGAAAIVISLVYVGIQVVGGLIASGDTNRNLEELYRRPE